MKALKLTAMLLCGIVILSSASAYAQVAGKAPAPENMAALIDMLRSDLQQNKAGVVKSVMAFSDDEAAAFWPVYKEFEAELDKIGDERVALIKYYVENLKQMTDQKADSLVSKTIDVEKRRIALKEKYYEKFKKVLSPIKAAKFMQLENQLLMMLDLQIASNLPFIR